jgi:hypothetical protein
MTRGNFGYLEHAFRDCKQVELRHQDAAGNWTAGAFDNLRLLLDAAGAKAEEGNLYCSLNEFERPATNKLQPHRKYEPIRNQDITRIRRIPLDFDPIRPHRYRFDRCGA